MKRFWTTFRYTFGSLRGAMLGWGLGLAGYGLMIVPMYEAMAAQQDRLEQLIASYPPEFLAFFGGRVDSLMTPAGFLGMYAFSMLPLILGIFAVLAGSGLIVSDEERGRLDLIISHPVGRTAFFLGRFMALISASVVVTLLGWLGFSLLLGTSSLGFTWGEMAVPFISMLLQILIYAALALMLSTFLPARSMAAMVSGLVLITSYFVSSLSFMDERMGTLAKFLPYEYFQSVMTFEELNAGWLAGLLAVTLAMGAVAWLRFARRDIRLSGEGSWRLPVLGKRAKAAKA